MEIRVLRYFLTVVREESINRAAEALHITQPTLSRQLAQLEEEIGVKLFERGVRKITLTAEGILLRRRAEEILSLVDRTRKELHEQEAVAGRIVIGSGELAAVEVLRDIIKSFAQKYPLVTYDIFTANADTVKEQMEKGLIDIGVLLEPIDIDKFDFIRLRQKERWVVLMRSDDPLAEHQAIRAQDLADKPIILPRRLNVRNELLSWFGESFDEAQIRFTSNFNTNGAIMVAGGLGYSVVVEGAMPFGSNRDLVYRPLEPELTADSVFAWRRKQPFSLAVTKFIEHIQCFLGISDR